MSFFEVQFPTFISFRAVGGPSFSTTINQGLSGGEQRNRNWAKARRKFQCDLRTPQKYSGNRQQFIDDLLAFFLNVGGMADGFRFRDHRAYKAVGQPLVAVAGGVQCAVTRTVAGRSYVDLISKPVTEDVVDYTGVNLVNTCFLHNTTTPFDVDHTTGLVTGRSAGDLVDFEYDIPVRLEADDFQLTLEESPADEPLGSWNSIGLIEVLAPNF